MGKKRSLQPALERLKAIAEMRSRLAKDEAAAVRDARAEGASWSTIGATLGISKQAIHHKYGKSS